MANNDIINILRPLSKAAAKVAAIKQSKVVQNSLTNKEVKEHIIMTQK